MKQKQTATRVWLFSIATFGTLFLGACSHQQSPSVLKPGMPAPASTTAQDRERGWKLIKADASKALRDDGSDHGDSQGSLLSLIFILSSYGNRAPVDVDAYIYKPIDNLFCQLYYNGNKAKKRGEKIGKLKSLPDKKLKTLGAGSLSFSMKGGKDKNPPPMRLTCSEDKKAFPKKLPSEAPEGLQTIDVSLKEK